MTLQAFLQLHVVYSNKDDCSKDFSNQPVIGDYQFCQQVVQSSLHGQEPIQCKNTET